MPVNPNPITPLPIPPSTSDPANFDPRADTFLGALPGMVTETNQALGSTYTNATEAAASATAAETSKNAAAASATAAETSKNAAAASATAAETSKNAAQAANTDIQKYYLGRKSTPPTTDNQGNPLQPGAWYTNTNGTWYWWNNAWVPGVGDIAGSYLPLSGGNMLGAITVPANATGNQVPRANEVTPREAAYYSTATPMSASPPGTVGFFESTTGGGTDWPMQGSLTVHGWVVETWDRGGVRTVQTATFAMASGSLAQGTQFRRYQVDGVWYPWARAVSDLDFREKVYATNTGVGPGDAKVYYLDPSKGSIHQLTVQYNTYFTGALRGLGDQITLRLKFSGGAWPISFNTNFRFPAGTAFPTYVAGQTLTLTFFNTEGSFIDAFIAGVHNP